jgi:hypothetical protein
MRAMCQSGQEFQVIRQAELCEITCFFGVTAKTEAFGFRRSYRDSTQKKHK